MPISYQPLSAFLAAQLPATDRVVLTLLEIEALLGGPLPAGAWARAWWTNVAHHTVTRPWVQAGWLVSQTAMRRATPTVTFVRTGSASMA